MTLASRRFRGLTVDAELINCWPKLLLKKELVKHNSIGLDADFNEYFLLIQDRGKTQSVPLSAVLYFRAELKYITVRTAAQRFIFVGSLVALEARHSSHFLRIHRHTLVARHAVKSLSLHAESQAQVRWALGLQGVDELLAVSRRQLSALRNSLSPCYATPPQCR
jgi:two-component system response regulator AlgR